MRRFMAAGTLSVALLAGLAGQALAGEPVHFSFVESWTIDRPCGIVEETTLSGHGQAYFDAEGNWIRDVIKFTAVGTFTNTATGEVMTGVSNQSGEFTPETFTLRGQGIFLRGHGGVVFYDVGRLVSTFGFGETLSATPKALPVDDAAGFEALDAALCEALG